MSQQGIVELRMSQPAHGPAEVEDLALIVERWTRRLHEGRKMRGRARRRVSLLRVSPPAPLLRGRGRGALAVRSSA